MKYARRAGVFATLSDKWRYEAQSGVRVLRERLDAAPLGARVVKAPRLCHVVGILAGFLLGIEQEELAALAFDFWRGGHENHGVCALLDRAGPRHQRQDAIEYEPFESGGLVSDQGFGDKSRTYGVHGDLRVIESAAQLMGEPHEAELGVAVRPPMKKTPPLESIG